MSRSPTITDEHVWSDDPEDWLPNPHAGEMLRSEFLEPLGLSPADLAQAIGVAADRVTDVVQGRAPMDAELDLRLGRYFRMNEGFFLGLQADYELLEQRRVLGSALDRIAPRAA
jgi:antitoxin HigA-1